MLKEKIEDNKQSINETINQVWQSEEKNESVADKAIFDTLIKQASKPLQS